MNASKSGNKSSKSRYQKAPELEPATEERFVLLIAAASGAVSVSEAARRLGMSRNRFQSLMHLGLGAFIEAIEPKTAGRKAMPEAERELTKEVEELRRENEKLRQRVGTVDRLLLVASDMMRGQVKASGRQKKSKKATTPSSSSNEPEEPDGDAKRRLQGAEEMRALGLTNKLCAAVAGTSAATLRRWRARQKAHLPLRRRRVQCHNIAPGAEQREQAEQLVRKLRGQVGAESLRQTIEGISRRQALAIKRETLTAMERERQAACERITVTTPGVMRGFDAMHLGPVYALVAADACVPFRTSALVVEHYDSHAVAKALDDDFRKHGAPLVLRMDRASCHRTDEVSEILRSHQVLVLHGPPHHPGFYGQLERQNREHRAWLRNNSDCELTELQSECTQMLGALNTLWKRRKLGWRTPAELWFARPRLNVDRAVLRAEVLDRAARLAHLPGSRDAPHDFRERIAIEATLSKYGFLHRQKGHSVLTQFC